MDSYKISAKHYDQAYAAKEDLVDLPFYLEIAGRIGGPVLEIACGTGRVLLPTARAGIQIHGVDNSVPMLQVLTKHLERESREVQDRVSISEGDMRTFRLLQKYPLVTIPFRPMQHMYTLADQLAAFQTAAFHLAEDGILAFDVFYPKFEFLGLATGQETLELEWRVPSRPGTTVRRFIRKDSVDKINQTFSATFFFRTYEEERLVLEETEPLKLSYYTYPQLRALFLLAGLEVAEEYGSFAKTPLDNRATEMIFLLRKPA
jgi:SAM-dependent methyltransferase